MADSIAEVLDGEGFATAPALCVLGEVVGKLLCRVHIDQRVAVTEAWINGLRDGMKGKT